MAEIDIFPLQLTNLYSLWPKYMVSLNLPSIQVKITSRTCCESGQGLPNVALFASISQESFWSHLIENKSFMK